MPLSIPCPSPLTHPGIFYLLCAQIFTGELHCLAKDRWLHLRLTSEGTTFADTVWLDCATANNPVPLEAFIEGTKDSSRYFVIRVGDPGPKPRRAVPLGIGFRERSSAFDLNAAIRDRIHLVQRGGGDADEGRAGVDDAKEIEEAEAKLAAAAQDLSLKEGQRIRVQIKGKKAKGEPNPLGLPEGDDDGEGEEGDERRPPLPKAPSIALVQKGGSLLLAPPPSLESSVAALEEREKESGATKARKKGKKSSRKAVQEQPEDDDALFDDFQAAPSTRPPAPPPPASTAAAADDDDFGDFNSA